MDTGEPLVLDPFRVVDNDSEGYRAQSSASGLPFVVPLDKTPLPITVITSEFLLDTASFNVEDSLRFTSGIANSQRNEYGSENYVIRGFQTSSLFVNGLPMRFPTDSSLIERVEVVKGPSTILYGSVDAAGLVNVIPKRAKLRNQTEVSQTWNEYGTTRSMIDTNYAIPGKLGPVGAAVRMVATWADENSYLPNEFRERLILAPSVRFDLARSTIIDFNFVRQDENGAINRTAVPFVTTGEPGTQQAGFVPVARDFTAVTPHDEWHYHSRYYGAQLTHEFSKSLHLLLGYAYSDIFVDQYFFLGSGNIRPTATGEYRSTGKMTTQITDRTNEVYTAKLVYDLEFAATQHKLALIARRQAVIGDQYGFNDSRQPTLGPYIVADANGALPIRFPGLARSLTDPRSPFAVASLGNFFAQDFNPQMNWNVGLIDYVTLLSGRLNLLAGAQYNTIRAQDRHAVVPQAGAVYELRPGLNAYALYSETFAPNGRSDTTNPRSAFLPPEEGKGMEIGLKVRMFEDKLYGSVAAYDITRTNVEQILAGVINSSTNIRIPSGEERARGFEADLQYRPNANFSVNLAYANTDAYISKQNINADNPDLDGNGVSDAVGQKKEGVAKHDIRVWTRYEFLKGSSLDGLALGGGFTWREGPIQQFGTFLQRKARELSDPKRLDLFISYRTKVFARPVNIRANWQNATDEVYHDRRGLYVIPSTVVLSISAKL